MASTSASGVAIEGTRRNPYQFPNMQVQQFNPSSFILCNTVQLVQELWDAVPIAQRISRLGIEQQARMILELTFPLHTQCGNHNTLASSDRVCVSLEHQDDYDTFTRVALFDRVEEQFGRLDFIKLYRQACTGPPGGDGVHVQVVLEGLTAAVPGGRALPSAMSSRLALQTAIRLINNVISPGPFHMSTPQSLIGAWHHFVTTVRHPQLQRAEAELARADRKIERLAGDLVIRGAAMSGLRERLATIYVRIFQLRLLVQAYIQGVWE